MAQQPRFKFFPYDSHERYFWVWACEYACVCARSEQRDNFVRKPLYPYVAHYDGKFLNIYGGSTRGVNCIIVVIISIIYTSGCCCFSSTTTAASSHQKGLALPRYNSRASSFSLCDSHERCLSVWVRERACMCAKSEQRHIKHTVVVIHKPVRADLWQLLAHACTVNA